jgi:hypothetical protein
MVPEVSYTAVTGEQILPAVIYDTSNDVTFQ